MLITRPRVPLSCGFHAAAPVSKSDAMQNDILRPHVLLEAKAHEPGGLEGVDCVERKREVVRPESDVCADVHRHAPAGAQRHRLVDVLWLIHAPPFDLGRIREVRCEVLVAAREHPAICRTR